MTKTKPQDRAQLTELEQIPNVGPAIADDLRILGVRAPRDLRERDPYAMYGDLCRLTRKRHDPCVLDVFIAVVGFMNGQPAKPWWKCTAERKREVEKRKRAGNWTE